VQRVGQHLEIEPGEVWAHLQGGGAAIDHDAFAGLAQRRGGAADGLLAARFSVIACSNGVPDR
jgi:hypothetical protein